jgi:beta-lactamase class D
MPIFSRLALTLGLVALTSGCALLKPKTPAPSSPESYFSGTKACFLLFNMKTKSFEKVIGESSCKERLPAASTFKVPLAVMAFDAKILKDENTVLKWDGKVDAREEVNRDHSAKTWMRDSVVWYSQRITQKLGKRRLEMFLQSFRYGNQDLRGGLTQAWLLPPTTEKGALKISAYEQVEFLKHLWTDSLPASKRSMRLAREITFLETSSNGFALHGKTGSNFYDADRKVHMGWFIAHVQNGEQEYIAVTNFSDLGPTEIPGYGGLRAKRITLQILTDLGLW